jgi:shikimate kinase
MTSHHRQRGTGEQIVTDRVDQVMSRNQAVSIVITGFMGTGKTSVGEVVASRMERAFVDMDAVIQAREGTTVQEIFATRGEAYFRACEKKLCKELGRRKNLIIATGGGTLLDPGNRACFREVFVVCLDATVDALLERLKNASDRPLLQGDEVRRRLASLMRSRRAAYAELDRHVDTTGKSVEQVAAEIIALFRAGRNGAGRGAD